jgi:hypothetical protein
VKKAGRNTDTVTSAALLLLLLLLLVDEGEGGVELMD